MYLCGPLRTGKLLLSCRSAQDYYPCLSWLKLPVCSAGVPSQITAITRSVCFNNKPLAVQHPPESLWHPHILGFHVFLSVFWAWSSLCLDRNYITPKLLQTSRPGGLLICRYLPPTWLCFHYSGFALTDKEWTTAAVWRTETDRRTDSSSHRNLWSS